MLDVRRRERRAIGVDDLDARDREADRAEMRVGEIGETNRVGRIGARGEPAQARRQHQAELEKAQPQKGRGAS
jgi:hypothetical protein